MYVWQIMKYLLERELVYWYLHDPITFFFSGCLRTLISIPIYRGCVYSSGMHIALITQKITSPWAFTSISWLWKKLLDL